MNELTAEATVSSLITKGNEITSMSKQAPIFRALAACLAEQLHLYLSAFKRQAPNPRTGNQIRTLHRRQFPSHVSENKWVQSILNSLATCITDYIVRFGSLA
jgi:hypothetical protein